MMSQLPTRRAKSRHPNTLRFDVLYCNSQYVSNFRTLHKYRASHRIEFLVGHLGRGVGWSDGTVEAVRRLDDESFILRHV